MNPSSNSSTTAAASDCVSVLRVYKGGLLRGQRLIAVSNFWGPLQGADPVAVVRYATKYSAVEDGDQLWAVVDVDEHANLGEAIVLAREHGVRLVITNPCFELWLLWHVKDHRRYDERGTIQKMMQELGLSGKNLAKDFPVARFDDAMSRAKQGECSSPVGDAGKNPSSGIPALIDALLAELPTEA